MGQEKQVAGVISNRACGQEGGSMKLAAIDVGRRQNLVLLMVIHQGEANLFQVVAALGLASGFACQLDGGQNQSNQHCNDGDDDQQLDKCEAW